MKKFIQTLKNIWSIEELRSKILVTITLIAVYRLGTHIVLPGINPDLITQGNSSGGILGLIDAFAGGAFSQASILALGIMPYISRFYLYSIDDHPVSSFPEITERRRQRS